jgi:hypothetical protein
MTWTKHNPDPNRFYVYQYLRDDGTPYYIGKGSGKRIMNPHFVEVPPNKRREFVQTGMTEVAALALEESLTKKYGLLIDGSGILENKIHGGGPAGRRGFLGKTHSEDTKRRISDAQKGAKRTAEQRGNYKGTAASLEAEEVRKDKIRLANINRLDDGRYKKMAETKKGKPWTQARRDAFNKAKGATL